MASVKSALLFLSMQQLVTYRQLARELAHFGMSVRVNPNPVKPVDCCLVAKLLDFLVALHLADVRRFLVFPLLKTNFLFFPRVGKDSVWWDLAVRGEVYHLPTLCAEESHFCGSTRWNDPDGVCNIVDDSTGLQGYTK
jgi:hypothetical protein